MTITTPRRIGALVLVAAFAISACGPSGASTPPSTGGTEPSTAPGSTAPESQGAALAGTVTIDGSSTVFPITAAVAEDFQIANAGVQVPVALSGTGGGFKKFCVGETDINDASRPIKADDEGEGLACTANNIEFVELQVAIDGLTVVVNPENTFASCLTIEELAKIYGPDSPENLMWSDVRADFPAQPVNRFMPGADSGTFDYFTEVINGEVDASTQFATQNEDDNVLVTGVAGDVNAIGYLRLRLLRREPGQAQGPRGRWRLRLRRADRGNDQRQQLRPAQPPAVHLPGYRQGQGATGAQGVRRLLPRQHLHALG